MAKKRTAVTASERAKRAARKEAVKPATRRSATKAKGRKPNAAFMTPMTPSAALGVVIGTTPLPRTEVTKRLWAYIKQRGLQDRTNRRNINADASLQVVFGGKRTVDMFEMTKLVNLQLKHGGGEGSAQDGGRVPHRRGITDLPSDGGPG